MWYVPVARIQTLAPNSSVECTILQLSLAITWLYQSHVTYLSSSNKTRVAPLVLLLTSVTWPISLPLLVQVAWHIQQDHVTFIKQWERSSSITCSDYFTLVQLYKANHVTQDHVTFMKQWELSMLYRRSREIITHQALDQCRWPTVLGIEVRCRI